MKKWKSVRQTLAVWLLFPLSFVFSSLALADSESPIEEVKRPKIAVVLAGGGAKGAAHIGVLKALEEMHIPVDYLTGTSMGAYVGGLYATGMSADEIESFIYTVDWNSGYRDRVERSQRRVRDKESEDRYQLRTDLGLRFGEVRTPRGFVQGQNMLRILRETTGNLNEFNSFDELAIPYRSVATDIVELKEVVIDKGQLVDAMMASMSVPGALPPYELDGHMLVDGGVINNMPVDVARTMGADIVIAVDISTDYKSREDFTTFLVVADQLSNYLVRRSTQRQAASLTEQDIYLRPEVGKMETTEFDKMPEAYQAGYDATYSLKEALKSLALSSADYQGYVEQKQRTRRKLVYGDQMQIDEIVLLNNTHYSDRLLSNRLDLKTGKVLKTQEVEAAVENLYALDRFELVSYHYQESEGINQLVMDVKEKSWGPNYVNFRFFLEDDFATESQYGVGLSTNFTNLNSQGAELTINLEMGTDKLAEAELYTPIRASQDIFSTAKLAYTSDKRNVPITEFDEPSLSAAYNYLPLTYSQFTTELAIGFQPELWQEFKLGGRFNKGDIEASSFDSAGSANFQRLGAFAQYRLDTLDDYSLPTSGWYLDLEYLVSHDKSPEMFESEFTGKSSSDTVYELSLLGKVAQSYQRHTLVASAEYEIVESKNNYTPLDPKSIGGFLNLSGIPRNSLIGQNKFFTSLIYRYRWFDNDFGLFEAPVYLGASLEYGGVWSDTTLKLNEAPLYNAASIFAGIDSPIGPIVLAYARTEEQLDAVYFIIGTSYR